MLAETFNSQLRAVKVYSNVQARTKCLDVDFSTKTVSTEWFFHEIAFSRVAPGLLLTNGPLRVVTAYTH